MIRTAIVALFVAVALAAKQNEFSNLRLIETAPGKTLWMTQDEVFGLIQKDIGFMDITETPNLGKGRVATASSIPARPSHQSTVNALMSLINIERPKADLEVLSAFHNRYYRSETGQQSSAWIYETARSIASNSSNATVQTFSHSWGQNSVIAQLRGRSSEELVIVGSHQDSINSLSPNNGRAPGADDDGTGTISVLELFRVLVEAGFQPEHTIEFHWYSAEEVGLLGSQAVANDYKDNNKAVRAMLQMDMTGYTGTQDVVGLVTDYTDSELNAFLRLCIDEYLTIPYVNSVCNYGCSDHASWNKAGYRSAFPFEAEFGKHSPYIHTAQDTIDHIDFNHVHEFIKLGLAFLVEVSYI